MLSSPPPTSCTKSGDLSATAATPGTTNPSNGHHQGELSPAAPPAGITPIEVTVSASPSPSSITATTTGPSGTERICVACQQPIRDRYLMCVGEHYWHEACLQCTVCRIILTNSCYIKERKVYCRSDYKK